MSGSSFQHHIPQLSGTILSGLYPDSLVSHPETGKTPESPQAPHGDQSAEKTESIAPSFLGENRKGILIGVDYADAATIREVDLTFLLNILNACKLGLRDVMILNLHGLTPDARQHLHKTYPATVFLLFGLNPADLSLPIRFPDYQRQTFDGVQYLSSPPLYRLEQDAQGKKLLWAGLKAIFLNS
jgi:hypothetical protein